ncbi:MAG: AAA family ATPase [Patescibacteria group bacterium]
MKLIIINGPCGAGKSTAAKEIHRKLPFSFLVEIDALRRLISDYPSDHENGFYMVTEIVKGIIETCMLQKKDVIIDKALYDPEVIDSFIEIGKKFEADIHEIFLWVDKEVAVERIKDRICEPGWEHVAAHCDAVWYELNELKNLRPDAKIINTDDLAIEDVITAIHETCKRPD